MFQGNITGKKKLFVTFVYLFCALYSFSATAFAVRIWRGWVTWRDTEATFPSFKCIYIFHTSFVIQWNSWTHYLSWDTHDPHHSKPLVVFAHVRYGPLAGESMWKMSLRLSCPGCGGTGPTRRPHVVADGGVWRGALLRAAVGRLRVRICPTIPPVFLASLLAVRTWQMPPSA